MIEHMKTARKLGGTLPETTELERGIHAEHVRLANEINGETIRLQQAEISKQTARANEAERAIADVICAAYAFDSNPLGLYEAIRKLALRYASDERDKVVRLMDIERSRQRKESK